jgi:hypothetical protein
MPTDGGAVELVVACACTGGVLLAGAGGLGAAVAVAPFAVGFGGLIGFGGKVPLPSRSIATFAPVGFAFSAAALRERSSFDHCMLALPSEIPPGFKGGLAAGFVGPPAFGKTAIGFALGMAELAAVFEALVAAAAAGGCTGFIGPPDGADSPTSGAPAFDVD